MYTIEATYDKDAATSWAQSCAYGCSECPDDSTCGCTYFTTHALSHGNWGYGYQGVCATLWSNFKAGKYSGWTLAGKAESDVHKGDAVIMNNGHSGDASHCCVGTGHGLVSCHNPGHQDVPPSSTCPYDADECNCVYYARDRQPKLPSGLSTCADKKSKVNSHTAAPGCVLFRTGDPTYCHAAYVTKVANGNVYYDQANWTPCKCSSDYLSTSSSAILGYWCP
eukprot:gene6478-8910_t